jgi:hypothetical protein
MSSRSCSPGQQRALGRGTYERPALPAGRLGPSLLDVAVNRQGPAMPPAIQLEQAKGFTLYMLEAVLSGRGDEILELARTNLWR